MQVNNTSSLEKLLLDIGRLKDSIAHQRSDALNEQGAPQEQPLNSETPIKTADEGHQTDNFLSFATPSSTNLSYLTSSFATPSSSFQEAFPNSNSMGSTESPLTLPEGISVPVGKGDKGKGKGKGKGGKGKGKGSKSGSGVYQMDTKGAMNRLVLLIGGQKAGNTSQAVKQEAANILDWLLNNKKIDVEEHKLLTQEVNS